MMRFCKHVVSKVTSGSLLQLNGKTTIIIVTIAYDNIVYDLYVLLLSGFLYFCILPMHIGFKFLLFFCFLRKNIVKDAKKK